MSSVVVNVCWLSTIYTFVKGAVTPRCCLLYQWPSPPLNPLFLPRPSPFRLDVLHTSFSNKLLRAFQGDDRFAHCLTVWNLFGGTRHKKKKTEKYIKQNQVEEEKGMCQHSQERVGSCPGCSIACPSEEARAVRVLYVLLSWVAATFYYLCWRRRWWWLDEQCSMLLP